MVETKELYIKSRRLDVAMLWMKMSECRFKRIYSLMVDGNNAILYGDTSKDPGTFSGLSGRY